MITSLRCQLLTTFSLRFPLLISPWLLSYSASTPSNAKVLELLQTLPGHWMITPVKKVHKLRSWLASLTSPQSVTIDSCVSIAFKLIMSFSMLWIDRLLRMEESKANSALPCRLHSCTRSTFRRCCRPTNQERDLPTSKALKSRPYSTRLSS